MAANIPDRPKSCPVFILPQALNSCAEDAARAIVDMLLDPPVWNVVVGPVYVLAGMGMVDLREGFMEWMNGRSLTTGWSPTAPAFPGCSLIDADIIGEGKPSADGVSPPMMLELSGETALTAELPRSPGMGFLVVCGDAQTMLTLAARQAGVLACHVHARDEDVQLAELFGALLGGAGAPATISAVAVSREWLLQSVSAACQRRE